MKNLNVNTEREREVGRERKTERKGEREQVRERILGYFLNILVEKCCKFKFIIIIYVVPLEQKLL